MVQPFKVAGNPPVVPNTNPGQQSTKVPNSVGNAPQLKAKKLYKDEIATELKKSHETKKYVEQLGDDLQSDLQMLKALMLEITQILNKMQVILEELGLTGADQAFKAFTEKNKKVQSLLGETEEAYDDAIKAVADVLEELNKKANKTQDDTKQIEVLEKKRKRLEQMLANFKNRDLKIGPKAFSEPALAGRLETVGTTVTTKDGEINRACAAFKSAFENLPDGIEELLTQLAILGALKGELEDMKAEATEVQTRTKVANTQNAARVQLASIEIALRKVTNFVEIGNALKVVHHAKQECDQLIASLCNSKAKGSALEKEMNKHAAFIKASYQSSSQNFRAAMSSLMTNHKLTTAQIQPILNAGAQLAWPMPYISHSILKQRKQLDSEGKNLLKQWDAIHTRLNNVGPADRKELEKLRQMLASMVDAADAHGKALKKWSEDPTKWSLESEENDWNNFEIDVYAMYQNVLAAREVVDEMAELPTSVDYAQWKKSCGGQQWRGDNLASKMWSDNWYAAMEAYLQTISSVKWN